MLDRSNLTAKTQTHVTRARIGRLATNSDGHIATLLTIVLVPLQLNRFY